MHPEQHISHQFDTELEAIKSHVLAMGGLVEKQIEDALTAIIDADSELAGEIIAREKQINGMEMSVDEEATRILVKRQPAASDLRMVLAITKAVRDLERIGDESKKIAKLALSLTEEGPLRAAISSCGTSAPRCARCCTTRWTPSRASTCSPRSRWCGATRRSTASTVRRHASW